MYTVCKGRIYPGSAGKGLITLFLTIFLQYHVPRRSLDTSESSPYSLSPVGSKSQKLLRSPRKVSLVHWLTKSEAENICVKNQLLNQEVIINIIENELTKFVYTLILIRTGLR